jgi:hypothetical protein
VATSGDVRNMVDFIEDGVLAKNLDGIKLGHKGAAYHLEFTIMRRRTSSSTPRTNRLKLSSMPSCTP